MARHTKVQQVGGPTLMRDPPLPCRLCPLGSVLTSSGAVVAGCAALTEKDPESGCSCPFTLTVMVPCGPAQCRMPMLNIMAASTADCMYVICAGCCASRLSKYGSS